MQAADTETVDRTDVVVTDSDQLARAIEKKVNADPAMLNPVAPDTKRQQAEADETIEFRKNLIEGKHSDPNGYERIIGVSNLLSINYLMRGIRASEAVCRIKLPVEGGHSYGTGFLVGPRLLMTNNHVLSTPDEAAQAEAEFGYEHDADGVLKKPAQFNLAPAQIFYTSTELDVTLVAVTPMSENGIPIDRYGWLPLIPMVGKAIDGEPVTIIQHPNGDPKQIAIHASKIIKLDATTVSVNLDHFIHYSTDTEPGSSGSPVLNDQWQVVALHHKAVPKPRPRNTPASEPIIWLANEGVRVTAIFNALERKRFVDDNARLALDRLARAMGFPPISVQVKQDGVNVEDGRSLTEQSAPFKPSRWKVTTTGKKYGYDPEFLSDKIDLDAIFAPLARAGKVAPLKDGSGHELRYWHYSSVLHEQRRFPLITAVNIHGNRLKHPGERKDTWRLDPRIDKKYQPDDDFYVRTRTPEKVYFSRGHLVRLLDPCWGDSTADAVRGMEDSFHFTNAAPQHQTYNDIDWGNLEDYILDKAQISERKLSVFTGPIFGDNDPEYGKNRPGGPWQIPLSFWKIAVLQKDTAQIAAAAFVIGQTEYVKALYEARVFSGLKPYSIDEIRSRKIQTTIQAVELETGLDFSALHKYDSHGSLESTRQTRWFNRLDDVLI